MPTTPTGNLAATIQNLETLIASSSTFQSSTASADVTAARDHIYWTGSKDPSSTERPFAWITLQPGWQAASDASGPGGFWRTMPLQILFEKNDDASLAIVPTDSVSAAKAKAKERQIVFLNWLGAIISEMEALAKGSGYLWVTRFNVRDHKMNPDDEAGFYQWALVEVQVF